MASQNTQERHQAQLDAANYAEFQALDPSSAYNFGTKTHAFRPLYVGNCNFRGSSGGRNLALIMLTLIMSLWKPSVVNRGNPPKKGKKRLNEENLDQTQTDIRPPPICMDYVLRSHGSGTGGRHDHHS